jgi:hypothetical protein
MFPEPQAEHRWLQKLVGEWTISGECDGPPGEPKSKMQGTEVVTTLGGLWTTSHGTMISPDGNHHTSLMTLGYDPNEKAFVGTFIASMMTHLWPYRGQLDEASQTLTLDSRGPNSMTGGQMAKYQDIIAFLSDDHRVLRSQYLDDTGQWIEFMKADYRRKA